MKLIFTFYLDVDTAAVYGNEEDIGIALKTLLPKYKLKRQDIFITSKLGLFKEPGMIIFICPTIIYETFNIFCFQLQLHMITVMKTKSGMLCMVL